MTVRISEQRTKEGYEITFFTDNKPLFRNARILLDELSSKERKRSNSEEKTMTAVVRCRDCKHYITNTEFFSNTCTRLFTAFPVKPNDFCSYGEQREGEQE